MRADSADQKKPIYLLKNEIIIRTHQSENEDGYYSVTYDDKKMMVHLGVLYAFKGGPNGRVTGDHGNRDKEDNRSINIFSEGGKEQQRNKSFRRLIDSKH